VSILGAATSVAQIALQTLATKPSRGLFTTANSTGITQIIKQVTIEEVHSDEMEITDHPVEQGSVISDHAFAQPSEVIITMGWSDSPNNSGLLNGLLGAAANASPALQTVIGIGEGISAIGSLLGGASSGPPTSVKNYNIILQLYNNRQLFNVYTGKRVYRNMLIKALATTTDAKTENSLILRVTCRQILMATTQTVTVPDSSVMANPEQNGATQNMGTTYPVPAPNINVTALP